MKQAGRQKLLDLSPAVLYVAELGPAGRWHYVSPAIQRLLGWSPGEWLADPRLWFEHINHDDREKVLALEASMRSGLRESAIEYRMRDRDGRQVYVRDEMVVIRERSEMLLRGSMLDVSRRRLAERELRASEERNRRLLETAQDGVVSVGTDGRVSYANGAMAAMLGCHTSDVLGRPFVDAVDESRRDRVEEAIEQVRLGIPGRWDTVLVSWDGVSVPARVAAAPLAGADGSLVGAIASVKDMTGPFRALTERATRGRQQSAVASLGRQALRARSFAAVADRAVELVARTLGVEYAKVLELLPGDRELVMRAGAGWPDDLVGRARVPANNGSQAGYTLRSAGPVIVGHLPTETRFHGPPLLLEHGVVSGLSVIIESECRPYGVLGAHATAAREFSPDDVSFLQAVANVLASASRRERDERRLRHESLHDRLTGLPNRALFLDRLEQALRSIPTSPAVVALDLDGFARINASRGQAVGDEVLIEAGRRMLEEMGRGATVARFGSDEFGVLIPDVEQPHDAAAAGKRLLAVMSAPFSAGGSEHVMSASVGIALANGEPDPSRLVEDAMTAVKWAKEEGGGRYVFFKQSLRDEVAEQLRLDGELRHALGAGQLLLHYQPIVSLPDGRPTGAEALVRWRHPTRGVIPPHKFIPAAERSELIVQVGDFVLREACATAGRADWRLGPVSVNLAPRQLAQRGLAERVATVLEESGLPGERLCLEITETGVLRSEVAAETLRELRALGVRIALDDFGTGYSSLDHVRSLPLDMLKLDRSFVSGFHTRDREAAVVAAVIQLGDALELDVVAEGVESAEQAELLRALGCGLAQGYYFAVPKPFDELATGSSGQARAQSAGSANGTSP